jgi:hypothetical protein
LHVFVAANADLTVGFLFHSCASCFHESSSMALHRDIYWVGRQWAVTGFGVQAVDQRLKGAFDIEASQVWDEGLQLRMCGHAWVNAQDLDKALTKARQRFPEPAKKSLPLVESVLELMQQPAAGPASGPAPDPAQQPLPPPRADDAGLQLAQTAAPVERPQTAPPPPLQLRTQGKLARFMPQWRVRR